MGKKDQKKKPEMGSGLIAYNSKKAAERVYGELDDFLDQMKMKIDRIERNFERLITTGRGDKFKAERDRIIKSIENDVAKVNKDIKTAEKNDLKKLHEDKAAVYNERLVKLKVKINKHKAKIDKLIAGGDEELENLVATARKDGSSDL